MSAQPDACDCERECLCLSEPAEMEHAPAGLLDRAAAYLAVTCEDHGEPGHGVAAHREEARKLLFGAPGPRSETLRQAAELLANGPKPIVCSKCGTAGCLEDAESGWYDEPEAEQPLAEWEQELLTEHDRNLLEDQETLTDIVNVALGDDRTGAPRDIARAVQAAGFRR